MKKRHEQKLVVLGLALLLIFNVPFILVFDFSGHIMGIPTLYFSIFSIWLVFLLVVVVVTLQFCEINNFDLWLLDIDFETRTRPVHPYMRQVRPDPTTRKNSVLHTGIEASVRFFYSAKATKIRTVP